MNLYQLDLRRPCDDDQDLYNFGKKWSLNELLEATEFVIEGDHFDVWSQYAKESRRRFPNITPVDWEQGYMGKLVRVGTFANQSVCITLSWSKLNGHIVMFYEGTSVVVHHGMIEEWLKIRCNPLLPNGRRAHADKINSHHCYHYVTQGFCVS